VTHAESADGAKTATLNTMGVRVTEVKKRIFNQIEIDRGELGKHPEAEFCRIGVRRLKDTKLSLSGASIAQLSQFVRDAADPEHDLGKYQFCMPESMGPAIANCSAIEEYDVIDAGAFFNPELTAEAYASLGAADEMRDWHQLWGREATEVRRGRATPQDYSVDDFSDPDFRMDCGHWDLETAMFGPVQLVDLGPKAASRMRSQMPFNTPLDSFEAAV